MQDALTGGPEAAWAEEERVGLERQALRELRLRQVLRGTWSGTASTPGGFS